MAESEVSGFDEKSQIWLQPFSEMINCMLPVEYIYGEWFVWQAQNEAFSRDPECIINDPSSIETGSRVEGFSIPIFIYAKDKDFLHNAKNPWTPDSDKMDVNESFIVNEETDKVIPIFTVEHASNDPRYVHLRFTDEWKKYKPRYKNATFVNHAFSLIQAKGYSDAVLAKVNAEKGLEPNDQLTCEMHGPVRRTKSPGFIEMDSTGVLKYPLAWAEPAMEWLVRPRTNGWPSPELLQDILESGCHLAPVGRGKRQNEPIQFLEYYKNPEKPSSSCKKDDQENPNEHDIMDETEWRLSFSVAENKLGQSASPVQRHVLVLLKMIKKFYFPDVISSYLLKNLLFWEIENQEPSFWTEANSARCVLLMLDRLQKSLEEGHFPHYIIPQSNLLQNEGDAAKLAEGAAVIADVRKKILTKIISLLKRCDSLSYHSHIYLGNLQDLDPLVAKIQEKSLSEKGVTALTKSVLALFIEQAKEEVRRIPRMIERDDDENRKKLNLVALYAYHSLLARNLCKMWYLEPDQSSDKRSREEDFVSFLRQETTNLSIDDDFVAMALAFYAEVQARNEMSLFIPQTNVMERTKEIHREKALHTFEDIKDVFGLNCLRTSDLKDIETKIFKEMEGQLENWTEERISDKKAKELYKLYVERCPSSQGENDGNNCPIS